MYSSAATPIQYIASLPAGRRQIIRKLRAEVLKNLPLGFCEVMNYGMICYVVPQSAYPKGYLGYPQKPLPFISIASQKNFVSLYHMGISCHPELRQWFKLQYASHCSSRLDMAISCIRFKDEEKIPYSLIGELSAKMTADQWIALYERMVSSRQKTKT